MGGFVVAMDRLGQNSLHPFSRNCQLALGIRSEMSESHQCHVTVVLLCMGRGADPNAYRPNRDETQWWSRRDALVRCVASFLFGPSPATNKDMILIFDDDWAQIHLSFNGKSNIIPTERTILSLFKQAAQSLDVTVTKGGGLSCRISIDPRFTKRKDGKSGNVLDLPTGLDSKRQLLDHLQKNCSIDFLRANGLNSNPTVILRKTNKKALIEVWNKWRKQHDEQKRNVPTNSASSDETVIETLYSEIIATSQRQEANQTLIVGTLHETCTEFPCFGLKKEEDTEKNDKLRVMLFLGAVRDMTHQENKILDRVCKRLDLPLVGIRFGTVPEFTSKILSILAVHHSQSSKLQCAMKRLVEPKLETTSHNNASDPRKSTSLHMICVVPLATTDISLALEQRDRIHWCMVRITVCTLWRSRLASSTASTNVEHTNTLTFVFENGVSLHLTEDSFVSKLASKHQAAPSEYQILAAIRALLDTETLPTNDWSKKVLASEVIDRIVQSSPQQITATISISPTAEKAILQQFYDEDNVSHNKPLSHSSIIAIVDIHHEQSFAGDSDRPKLRAIHRTLLRASEKHALPTYFDSMVDTGEDYDGACITLLQHLLYQNKLFTNLPALSGKKRLHYNR